jgi:putative copper export protein
MAYLCATVLVSATIPLLGHAAGSPARHALHTIHLLSGAVWLGSLAVLVRLRNRPDGRWLAESSLPLEARFSPLALTTGTLVGASGVAAAWIYLAGTAPLVSTAYGRLLLTKVACVAVVLACGWRNWQRVRSGALPSLAVMGVEVASALAVVMVTSVLTETEHP